jgi:hypothetical protein
MPAWLRVASGKRRQTDSPQVTSDDRHSKSLNRDSLVYWLTVYSLGKGIAGSWVSPL